MLSPCPLYRNQLISLSLCRVLHLLVVLTPLSSLCVVSNFVLLLLLLSTYQWQITKQVTRLDSQPNPTELNWTELNSSGLAWTEPNWQWEASSLTSCRTNRHPQHLSISKNKQLNELHFDGRRRKCLIPCRSCAAKLYINLMDVSSQVVKIYI